MSKRTALLTKEGKKYALFLFENENHSKTITIQSEEEEIVGFTLKNRLGYPIEEATYSMVAKGSVLLPKASTNDLDHKSWTVGEGYEVIKSEFDTADGPEEKKRRLEDLLFYHRAVLETGTSKSSKLAKVKKMADGSRRCLLCGASGTTTDKIEASHVLQKQFIYATGGEEALLTLDALKNWSAGQGWKRPFKIDDPMNLIWLCQTHKLAFDRYEFGLSLGALDNKVVFYSCLERHARLVADANARLADPAEPFFDLSYVSRRAIGMRLCKAQSAGYFADHDNADASKAVVALSATASLKHGSDSDDEDEQ